jgi:hypothetical protein
VRVTVHHRGGTAADLSAGEAQRARGRQLLPDLATRAMYPARYHSNPCRSLWGSHSEYSRLYAINLYNSHHI